MESAIQNAIIQDDVAFLKEHLQASDDTVEIRIAVNTAAMHGSTECFRYALNLMHTPISDSLQDIMSKYAVMSNKAAIMDIASTFISYKGKEIVAMQAVAFEKDVIIEWLLKAGWTTQGKIDSMRKSKQEGDYPCNHNTFIAPAPGSRNFC